MLKTIIVLPDGTEVSSGLTEGNAIQSVTVTEMVNDSQELTLGSTCANMLEAKLITPAGGLPITAGDELTVYREENDGTRYKVGLFTTEKPTRPSANTMAITAYDRVNWLDKDLTLWLASLNTWPYDLLTFAKMVCAACGLTLINTQIPNGEYMVRQFSADGITGRKLIQWVGQIAGRFCRATVGGELEFAWYSPVSALSVAPAARKFGTVSFTDDGQGNITITAEDTIVADDGQGNVVVTGDVLRADDDGMGRVALLQGAELFYYMNSLAYEDYVVAPIEKVQLRQNEEDVGTVYPDTAEELNTYIITGNYLLTASSGEDLMPVAKTLYEGLQGLTYTPCKVSIPANQHVRAGSILQLHDSNGRDITMYVMTRTSAGQKDTLECTGSPTRASSAAVNNQTFEAYMGKVLNLRTDVDGLKVENKDAAGNLASLKLDLEGIASEVSRQQAQDEKILQQLTTMEQTEASIAIKVQAIVNDGVNKVTTEKGYTFNEKGLIISGAEDMENVLNEKGMVVTRGGEVILQANNEGVIATDVKVRNYLIVGNHARFEDYSNGSDSKRTACFFVEGG